MPQSLLAARASLRRCVAGPAHIVLGLGHAALAVIPFFVMQPVAEAATALSGPQLVDELRAGGCVLVLRHADSPLAAPSGREAESDNPHRERQLDEAGKASAREIGAALQAVRIPIGPIYSSPAYRALETVRLARLGSPTIVAELAEGARGMSGSADASRVKWLQKAVRRRPPAGTNTLVVTHMPNIAGAFGPAAAGIKAGEMLVFRPNGQGGRGATILGRIRVEDWRNLEAAASLAR